MSASRSRAAARRRLSRSSSSSSIARHHAARGLPMSRQTSAPPQPSTPGCADTQVRADYARFCNEIVIGNGGKQILLEDPPGNPIELFEPQRQALSRS